MYSCSSVLQWNLHRNNTLNETDKEMSRYAPTHFQSKNVITIMTYYYQLLESASDGIIKSPLGETLTVPTLGPSGAQFLLNWLLKNRLMKLS